ncbi:MAG: hypothetical protein P8H03_11750 [Emcibacteraceae bacterium]|nr:hypothetical protein [Emcibacteraceae bacterium]
MRIIKIILLASISIMTANFAFAENSKRYTKEMAKYDQAGEFKNCIKPYNIKNTTVLDNNHILFEMRGKRYLLNKLANKCHSLGFNRSFGYTARGGNLCGSDIITVLDNGDSRGSCGLGKFEVLNKKPISD